MWTPEQISGRAKLEKQPFSISYNTIYRAVHSGILPIDIKKRVRRWSFGQLKNLVGS